MVSALLFLFFFGSAFAVGWGWPWESAVVDGIEFRHINGSGNNIANPTWGLPFVAQKSRMPPTYYPDYAIPNNPASGKWPYDGINPYLPNVRTLSNTFESIVGAHEPNNLLLNQLHLDWGHLVTSDLMNTGMNRSDGTAILIQPDDYMADPNWGFASNGVNCSFKPEFTLGVGRCGKPFAALPVGRFNSYPGTGKGTTNPKLTFGDVSGWLDLSVIYGNPQQPQVMFGTTSLPWFNVSSTTHELLDAHFLMDHPWGADIGRIFVPNFPQNTKWLANGDFRINKTPGLRVLSELFRHEHNRLVDQFAAAHPEWSQIRLWHEARKWNIAFFQSITYREYLAASTGAPLPPYTGYNASLDPYTETFFAHVAYRYGHSAVPSLVPLYDNKLNSCPFGAIDAAVVFRPASWEIPIPVNPWVDPVTGATTKYVRSYFNRTCALLGLSHSESNKVDMGFVDAIRNTQSQGSGPRSGNDLAAIDILRGRDIGLPGYNDVREAFGFTRFKTFEEMSSNPAISGALKKLYVWIDHVDPFVGTFLEEHVPGAEMGELAIAAIHDQFGRLRDGDRFFFENSMTPEEIAIVHQTKLKDLFLRNFPELSPNALPVSSFFLNERQLTAFLPREKFPEIPPHPHGLPWKNMSLTDVYDLHWAIDRNKNPQEITFLIQVQTDGWAGIGFSPEAKGTMKGADIVICRISYDMPECLDKKAFDVGPPLNDSDVGGKYSLREVEVSRTDGILRAMFTRDLMSSEPLYDNDLPDEEIRVIFAFNPLTNELKYHGPTRNPDTLINFQDYVGPPQRVPITEGVTIFLYVITALAILANIIYVILVIAKKDHFRYQSPEFCLLINFGAFCGYASVILLLPHTQNDACCWASIWLFGMSFWLVFLGFFAKVARVYYILWKAEKDMQVIQVPIWQLLVFVGFALLCEAGFEIGWDVGIPPNLEREDFLDTNTYVLFCAGNRYMWLGSVVVRAVFLGLGVLLALQTRRLPKEFNWSKEVAISIYTMAVILAIGIPLGYALTGSSTMVVMLKGITTTIAYFTVTTLVHFDSLRRIFGGKGPREMTKTGNTISKTKQGTSVSTA